LIGKGHVFKKYGYGYGLGVTFVKKGIVYEKRCELRKPKVGTSTSPCIGIELANLRLDICLPLAYIFNANI
jgi:hypothetical protein